MGSEQAMPGGAAPEGQDTIDLASRLPAEDVTNAIHEKETQSPNQPLEEETESPEARIERLGRQRPEIFKSKWAEYGFIFSVVMSQALTEFFVSGFNVLLPIVQRELSIPPAAAIWPASAFSLVVSSFLLIFGRLADMYGGFPVYLAGTSWLTVWSLIAGFSKSPLMLDFCRAIQGLGPAAYLPASLMLLGSIYRPGPRKNLVFAIYGAMAPLGFFAGIFFAGVVGEYSTWAWYFWIGCIISAATTLIAFLTIPSDMAERRKMGVKMDIWGAILTSTGLILVVFAITDSSHAPRGWATPYIYSLLLVGVLILATAFYVEGWVSPVPLLPFDLFAPKHMKPLVVALFFSYGGLGILLLYSTFYMTEIMSASPMQLVAWFAPMALGGCIISTLGGFVLHLVNGSILILVASVAWIISPLLFAIAPLGANYWAYVFPSMLCATIGIDITFTITNIFITTQMPARRQGLAGALINSILQLSIAFFLGFGDLIATSTEGQGRKRSLQYVFWFEVAMAGVAMVLLVGFVRIEKARSDLTADEREAMEAEGEVGGGQGEQVEGNEDQVREPRVNDPSDDGERKSRGESRILNVRC